MLNKYEHGQVEEHVDDSMQVQEVSRSMSGEKVVDDLRGGGLPVKTNFASSIEEDV